MYLFKTRREHIKGVIDNVMHAFDRLPKQIYPGEIILVQQVKDTEMLKRMKMGEKPIKQIMTFSSWKEDKSNESVGIWGEHYKYLILCKNTKNVKSFDIQEIKVSKKNYGGRKGFYKVEPEDEKRVLEWIKNMEDK